VDGANGEATDHASRVALTPHAPCSDKKSESYVCTHAFSTLRWQNGGMPPSTLTYKQRRWYTHLVETRHLQEIYLKQISAWPDKTPGLMKKTTCSWHYQHVELAYPTYLATQIQHVVTSSTLGWRRDRVVFLFLKNAISQTKQDYARLGLDNLHYKPCNQSARKELKKAIWYNRHKNPEAGECNPGWQTRGGIKRKVDSLNNKAAINYLDPLVLRMSAIFQRTLPEIFGRQNPDVPAPFRHGLSSFTNLTILKSASSAIHQDIANGAGFACMTTVRGPGKMYTGGTFCFAEFGVTIAVKPGDILIANTPAHWHCNIGGVTGTKYSVIAYFQRKLTSPGFVKGYRNRTGAKFQTGKERADKFDANHPRKLVTSY
jgi:hypothetical protein